MATFWDKIGNDYDGTLASVGLNWQVDSIPVPVFYNGQRQTLPTRSLMRRNNSGGEWLANSSSQWLPLQNETLHNLATEGAKAAGGAIKSGGYLHGAKESPRLGDRLAFLCSDDLPALGFALFGDKLEIYSTKLIFYNHHNPGCGLGAKVICVRQICSNGMVAVSRVRGFQLVHLEAGITRIKDVDSMINELELALLGTKKKWEDLAKISLSPEDAREIINKHFGGKKNDSGSRQENVAVATVQAIYSGAAKDLLSDRGVDLSLTDYTSGTAYGVLQAATAYGTHFKQYGNLESKIRSSVMDEWQRKLDGLMNSLSRLHSSSIAQPQSQSVGVR